MLAMKKAFLSTLKRDNKPAVGLALNNFAQMKDEEVE